MKLTNRGWFVVGFVSALLLLGLIEISTNLWWTQNGYCWGQMTECLNNE
jgi:hypothetical protein